MKEKKHLKGDFIASSDIGVMRKVNEDRSLAIANSFGDVLLAVADGMGGQARGDIASQMTIDFLHKSFLNKKKFHTKYGTRVWLKRIIRRANEAVYKKSMSGVDYQGMGTTLTCVVISKTTIVVAQVGDSRAYTYTKDTFTQITEDQSLVEYYYRTKQITEEAKSTHKDKKVLTNALGTFPSLSLDIKGHSYHNESIFLCSDGLYNNLALSDIENILQTNQSLSLKADMLISSANDNKSNDNLSVVIWEAK